MSEIPKKFLFFIGCCFSLTAALGQDTEIGLTAGTSYYIGELNQKHFDRFRPAMGIVLRKSYHNRLALTYHLTATRLDAADSLQDDPVLRNRNLSFRSNLLEVGALFEINYFEFRKGSANNWVTPYLFFGFSAFYFNPQAEYNGQWHDLQPIGTEGQNMGGGGRYNLINFAIPLGAGIKIHAGNWFGITLYSGFRKTFTDHLDDVSGLYADPSQFNPEEAVFVDRSIYKSGPGATNTGLQRGNTNTRDWYNITGLMLTIKTNRKRTVCEAYDN